VRIRAFTTLISVRVPYQQSLFRNAASDDSVLSDGDNDNDSNFPEDAIASADAAIQDKPIRPLDPATQD
jgi:hypothetical protein